MLASLVTSSVSFVIIFVAHVDRTTPGLIDVSQPLPLAHFILGIIITGAQMTNAALSLCRCKPSHKNRWIYNIVHGKFIGYSTVKLAGRLHGDIDHAQALDKIVEIYVFNYRAIIWHKFQPHPGFGGNYSTFQLHTHFFIYKCMPVCSIHVYTTINSTYTCVYDPAIHLVSLYYRPQ